MIQYKKGDNVSVLAAVRGSDGRSGTTIVTGEVFQAINTAGSDLQCLIIYGTTQNGHNVRTRVYNDDRTLSLVSPSKPVTV